MDYRNTKLQGLYKILQKFMVNNTKFVVLLIILGFGKGQSQNVDKSGHSGLNCPGTESSWTETSGTESSRTELSRD